VGFNAHSVRFSILTCQAIEGRALKAIRITDPAVTAAAF
jgi:hypothetical protein